MAHTRTAKTQTILTTHPHTNTLIPSVWNTVKKQQEELISVPQRLIRGHTVSRHPAGTNPAWPHKAAILAAPPAPIQHRTGSVPSDPVRTAGTNKTNAKWSDLLLPCGQRLQSLDERDMSGFAVVWF